MAVRLKAFRPSVDKVYHLDIHPTQPWFVTSDGGDNVVLWDWEHRQVLYELNARGVDERQLVDSKLQKLAEGESDAKGRPVGVESIRGGGVKDIKFYDDDVRFWNHWLARTAAAESPTVSSSVISVLPQIGSTPPALRGRRFLVMCCENKVIFLDLVTMKSRDVPKAALDNKTPICVEFFPTLAGGGEGPFAAFGGSDGAIRVMSMTTWQLVRKFTGGHKKDYVNCLLTFIAPNGETLLVSGGADGSLVMWSTVNEGNLATREAGPKVAIPKAHDGGVYCITLARVSNAPPQLITCGADKTLAIWDSLQCRELKRIKPVSKMVCNSVSSWRHPRGPLYDTLTCVKDSHIWAVDKTGTTRAIADLANQVPATPQLAAGKKLKVYCMTSHPLQPHLVVVGTNMGVILTEFDPTALPSAAPLPSPMGSREHSAVFSSQRGLHLLSFQVAVPGPPVPGQTAPSNGAVANVQQPVRGGARGRADSADTSMPQVRQWRDAMAGSEYDSYATLSVSHSGRYVTVVYPDVPSFSIHRTSDWGVVDSGSARLFAWDTCQDRYAVLHSLAMPQKYSPDQSLKKSKSKAKAAAAAQEKAAQAAAAAAAAAASATVEIKRISSAGIATVLCQAIESRREAVIGLQGGALLGVTYRVTRKSSSVGASVAASAVSAAQGGSSLAGLAPGAAEESSGFGEASPPNFLLYSWDTFKPVSPFLPEPQWSAWDPIVEHCALAYRDYITIAVLRPVFRHLGSVAIEAATGGVWHKRQLFLATPTTIECLFVDAGVSEVDIERTRKKAEDKVRAAEAKAVAEKGELAVLTLEPPKVEAPPERIQLRPPMLQVVRLASFNSSTAVLAETSMAKPKAEAEAAVAELLDGPAAVRAPEVVVAGGGVAAFPTRLPPEQRRPPGPLIVVGVRDGFLWLVDRYYLAHAIALSHPGIRCRCLAAYGDPVSAVKWASRLGREHHDDMAQFMVGMGYAREALHLPGISKRYEFDLAMQVGEIQRALQCLLALSGTGRHRPGVDEPEESTPDTTGVLALAASQAVKMESAAGVARYAREYLALIDKADATGYSEVALQALRRLASAGSVEGALAPQELRGLLLRLATHGETYRLQMESAAMVRAGEGKEAALAAALLGDATMLEKNWHDTGCLPQAALHAQSHGRPTLPALMKQWNRTLQKQQTMLASTKPVAVHVSVLLQKDSAASAIQNLTPAGKQPIVEVVPPATFASAQDSGPFPGGGQSGPGFPQGLVTAGGVQGLRQPLDLSLLEGFGKGPAPQKGPAKIAVPVNLAEEEKKLREEKEAVEREEREQRAKMEKERKEQEELLRAAIAAGANGDVSKDGSANGEAPAAGMVKLSSVDDFDRAFFEGLNRGYTTRGS
eukprot:jgi/Mesen1/6469/ME000033S05753